MIHQSRGPSASVSSTTRWSDGIPTMGRLGRMFPTIAVYKTRGMGCAHRSVLEDRPHFQTYKHYRIGAVHRGLSKGSGFPARQGPRGCSWHSRVEVRMARRVRCSNAFSGHPLGRSDWAGDIEAPNTEEREHPGPCSLHSWQRAAEQNVST